MDLAERARDYVEALEEERRKIMVFQRELPLCLQLVTQAIESCKQHQQMGGEDASTDGGPVLEEFMPLKPSSSSSESEDSRPIVEEEMPDEKPDWLRSVQLWNHGPEPLPRDFPRKPVAVNARKFAGAFHPFEKEKHVPAPVASSTAETTTTGGVGGEEKDKETVGQSHRKARRCWSPELHRRFLHALHQLGGSHAATPKQIRELMKVDGLTNDEVKSHLQKYRLHARRPTPTVQSSSSSSPQTPHFVVVGGIWVPPQEYAAAAAAATAAGTQPAEAPAGAPHNGIYAPVASQPLEFRSKHQQQTKQSNRSSNGPLYSEGRGSEDDSSLADDGATNSASPTSSSSQTVTASPP